MDSPPREFAVGYVGKKGVPPVMRVVDVWSGLEVLSLRDSGVESGGMEVVLEVARRHPSLTSLDLGGNRLYATSGRLLARLLQSNPRITHLTFDEHHLPSRAVAKLRALLSANCKRTAPPPSPPPLPVPVSHPLLPPPAEGLAGAITSFGRIAVALAVELSPDDAVRWLARYGDTLCASSFETDVALWETMHSA
eukprot:Sspe_Gene.47333::Locus_24059_Transcript_1_1_Confidence_1.000_Length_704::g.47333::m.47333